MCIIIISNNLAILKLSELTLLWQSGVHFLLHEHQFQFYHHWCPLWHGHTSDTMTSKILRNCCVITNRNVRLEVNSIWSWLPCLHVHPIHYCLSLNLRNLMNHLSCLLHFPHHYTGNLLIATAHIEPKDTRLHFWWTKQDIVSYPLPEQQSTQVDYVIWYPCSVISKTKNHSRRLKYLPYVCCLPSRYST